MGRFGRENQAKKTLLHEAEGRNSRRKRKRTSGKSWRNHRKTKVRRRKRTEVRIDDRLHDIGEDKKASRKKDRTGNRHRWVGAECTQAKGERIQRNSANSLRNFGRRRTGLKHRSVAENRSVRLGNNTTASCETVR
jgi:hypothetical protein